MIDGELLSKYAEEACEASFRRLVERYLTLVQGVAVRKTGRPDLAEDIAMQVFAQAARKGRTLSRRASLGGWFVLAARLAAAQAVRRDLTRDRAMQKAADHSAAMHSDTPSQSEVGALPLLDDALARLSERERDAVILHFYNGMTFREIGTREGRSEDASRKRVGTALEKMSRFFQRRGIALSVTALTSTLSTEWAHAQTASAAAAAIAQKALGMAPSLSAAQVAGLSLTAMNITKTLTTAALIAVCCVPLAWQYQEISAARNRISALEKTPRPLLPSPAPAAIVARKIPQVPVPAAEPVNEPPKEIDLAGLAADFLAAKEGDLAARGRIRSLLEPLEAPKLPSLLESVSALGFPRDTAQSAIDFLVTALVSKDPEEAAKQSAKFHLPDQLRESLSVWTKADSAAALAWYREQSSAGALKDKGAYTIRSIEREATKGLAVSLYESDRAAGKALIETLSLSEAADVLRELGMNSANTKVDDEEIAAMAARLSSSKRAQVISDSVLRLAQNDRDAAASMIRRANLKETEQTSLLVRVASQGAVEEKSLQERLAWITEQTGAKDVPGLQGEVLAKSIGSALSFAPPESSEIDLVFGMVERLHRENGSRDLVARFLDNSSPIVLVQRPEKWYAMALSLPPGRKRDEYLEKALKIWTARDPAAAQAAAANPSAGKGGAR
ncbi:MAG TPA: RNA polymerase sigma factor [Verrucomicrobiales bacterium]|nr:RNA polymerase sigma factor [Verrucomicrobiales bacterium]